MGSVGQDLRFALRTFRRAPLFTAGVMLVLALGIGANGAIFSLVRTVLLQPMPYDRPDDVVMVWRAFQQASLQRGGATATAIRTWQAGHQGVFADLAAIRLWDGNLEAQPDLVLQDRAERLRAGLVTPNFFTLLGVRPHLGRVFTVEDEAAGAAAVVISHGLWQRVFGGDRDIVGRPITLTTGSRAGRQPRPLVVAGVLPPAFRFTYPVDTELWLMTPWASIPARAGSIEFKGAVARLAPGVSLTAAQAVMRGVPPGPVDESTSPAQRPFTHVEPVRDWAVGDATSSLLLLSAVALLLLVIACATVASALLVRAAERRREIALRLSLGAGRVRVVRQLLTEGVTVSTGGAVAGCLLAVALLPAFRSLVPPLVPRADEMAADFWMLIFGVAAATAVTVLATVWPALSGSRIDALPALKQSSGSATQSTAAVRGRLWLVGAQVAVASCLLVGTALLLVSFARLNRVDPGYDGDRVVTAEMRLLDPRYFMPKGATFNYPLAAFQADVMARLRSTPGIAEVGLTTAVPLRGVDFNGYLDSPGCEGDFTSRSCYEKRISGNLRHVDAQFFSVMRISLRRGRLFGPADTPAAPKVMVISERVAADLAAKNAFNGADPIGRTFDGYEIVGIVGDVRYQGRDAEPKPAMYFAASQAPPSLICLVVRASPGGRDIAAAIYRAVREVDPAVPVMNVATLDAVFRDSVADRRFYTTLTAAFSSLALLLTATGLIVVIARSVVERRVEMAIRTALGAQPAEVVGLAARQGALPVIAGAAAGLAAAWFGSRLIEGFLFEIAVHDLRVYLAAGAIILVVGAVGCLLPARRLIGHSPALVLRGE